MQWCPLLSLFQLRRVDETSKDGSLEQSQSFHEERHQKTPEEFRVRAHARRHPALAGAVLPPYSRVQITDRQPDHGEAVRGFQRQRRLYRPADADHLRALRRLQAGAFSSVGSKVRSRSATAYREFIHNADVQRRERPSRWHLNKKTLSRLHETSQEEICSNENPVFPLR